MVASGRVGSGATPKTSSSPLSCGEPSRALSADVSFEEDQQPKPAVSAAVALESARARQTPCDTVLKAEQSRRVVDSLSSFWGSIGATPPGGDSDYAEYDWWFRRGFQLQIGVMHQRPLDGFRLTDIIGTKRTCMYCTSLFPTHRHGARKRGHEACPPRKLLLRIGISH
jgi:hypothetical protein